MCKSIVSPCVTCNKKINHVSGKSNKFCSIKCYRAHQRSGAYKTGHKKESKKKCSECSGVTYRSYSTKRNGEKSKTVFCSRACYDKSRSRVIESRSRLCPCCGVSFGGVAGVSSNKKYCSEVCRRKAELVGSVSCKVCSTEFSAIKRVYDGRVRWYVKDSKRKTCSDECLNIFYRTDKDRKEKISKAFEGEKHPNWQGGTHNVGSRGAGWLKIAEACRSIYNYKCDRCGMSQDDSVIKGWGKLQVNHIIPFHQWLNKNKANSQSNLEALCKSCHTKTDWEWRKNNQVQLSLPIYR